MALLTAKNITFTYPDADAPALNNVSLTVHEGELIALCGPSGSGKSTLLRLFKQEIAPHGKLEGEILYNEAPLAQLKGKTAARTIGMVFQDPENQIVMDHVMDELIFGLENIGMSTEQMRKKTAEMVHFFGLEALLDIPTHALSGGQKQIINLAGVLLMEPRVLLLDEPTSQLDPIAAKDFLNIVRRMNEELGITVIIAEHRLEDVWPIADRVVVLEKGHVIHDGTARQTADWLHLEKNRPLFDYLPSASRLFLQFTSPERHQPMPITVKEGMQWVRSIRAKEKVRETHTGFDTNRPVILEAKNIDFQYEVNMPRVLDRLSVSLEKGEKLAVVGGNGSGKSTLLKVLAGLMRPQRGKVYFNGKKITGQLRDEIAYLPQNPRLYFSEESVKLEMEKAAAESHASAEITKKLEMEKAAAESHASAEITKKMMEQMHLSGLKNRHPYDLSGGEMQKLAMACLLLRQPAVLLIDEPTKGLDPESKKRFGQWLNAYSQQGISIMFVTHDIEFAARFADRVAMMFHGEITAASDTESFFKGNAFYTTAIDRMTRKAAVPEVLTVEEAERKWVVPNGFY